MTYEDIFNTKGANMADRNLTLSQRGLLEWIGGPGLARHHECSGEDLGFLIGRGLVQVNDDTQRSVTLTPAGRALLAREEE